MTITNGQQAGILAATKQYYVVSNRNTNAFLHGVHRALGLQTVGAYADLSFTHLQRKALLNAADKYSQTNDAVAYAADVQAALDVQPALDVEHGACSQSIMTSMKF